jgi:branched-chain amino acid transport system permease protein
MAADTHHLRTSYRTHSGRGERVLLGIAIAVALLLPFVSGAYLLESILIPFLVMSLAAVGLNVVTGMAGQISLGSSGFMAVGAYTVYVLQSRVPALPFPVAFLLAGLLAAVMALVIGLSSARIGGFYIAVATLAAEFFIEWVITHVPWLTNHNLAGVISTRTLSMLGIRFDTPGRKYLLTLVIVVGLARLVHNLSRSAIGRAWIALRDMEVAAASMGIRALPAKLSAFAVWGFYCAIAGGLWSFVYLGTIDAEAFHIHRSFQILFMIIIGGLGSTLGAFLGSAFLTLMPILLNIVSGMLGRKIQADTLANLELMIFGGLIVLFLILEPHGLARLMTSARQKLRAWPFAT